MGFSVSGNGCKKHPYHQEKQGVCPSCLRERLSRLCSASNKEANSRVAPSLSFSPAEYSSAWSSKSSSPARRRNFHKRNGSGVLGIMGSSSFRVKFGTSNGLKKSRSIAFVPRNLDHGQEAKNIEKKKKGFWSNLLPFKGKKDVLTHSTSMRFMVGRVN